MANGLLNYYNRGGGLGPLQDSSMNIARQMTPQMQFQNPLLGMDLSPRQPTFGDQFRTAATGGARGLGGLFTGEGSSARLSALGASLLAGPSRTPISFGSSLAQGLLAGNIAAQQEEERKFKRGLLEQETDLAKERLEIERKKLGGLFGGTSMTAQSMNIIRRLGPKIQANIATPQEIQDFKLAEASVSKRRVQEFTDPVTGVTTRTDVPGINIGDLGFPTFQEKVSLGEKEPKYTEGQLEAGKFGNVMWHAERELGLISGEGYDATNLGDRISSLTPNTFRNYLTTPEGQRYQRAKQSFLLATLRDESGAAIATKEYKDKEFALFPLPGDSPELVRSKARARQAELDGIVKSSGRFYERSFKGQTIENLYKPDAGTGFNLSVYGTKGQQSNPIMVKSEAEGDALPPGTFYILSDGRVGRAE